MDTKTFFAAIGIFFVGAVVIHFLDTRGVFSPSGTPPYRGQPLNKNPLGQNPVCGYSN
jgi:hypothetical protein